MPQDRASVPEIEAFVRSCITTSYLTVARAEAFRNDHDLLALFDSLQILRMIIHLESTYAIKVQNSELTPENLGTVEKVAAFIARKVLAAPPVPEVPCVPAWVVVGQ